MYDPQKRKNAKKKEEKKTNQKNITKIKKKVRMDTTVILKDKLYI